MQRVQKCIVIKAISTRPTSLRPKRIISRVVKRWRVAKSTGPVCIWPRNYTEVDTMQASYRRGFLCGVYGAQRHAERTSVTASGKSFLEEKVPIRMRNSFGRFLLLRVARVYFESQGLLPKANARSRKATSSSAGGMAFTYGANERSQKLKHHIQTSGRSLRAQEIQFDDIGTTLQAMITIYDNCNSPSSCTQPTLAVPDANRRPTNALATARGWAIGLQTQTLQSTPP